VEVDSDREPLVDFGSDFVRKKYSHKQRTGRYRSLSAMALMRRVTPPACVTNPYLKNISAGKREPFIYQRSTSPGTDICSNDFDFFVVFVLGDLFTFRIKRQIFEFLLLYIIMNYEYEFAHNAGLCPSLVGGRRGLSRYHNDFNEIEVL